MRETEDPRAAVRGKSLPEAAAAARDLGRMGTWDDVPGLLELATTHRRTGLRLAAAAAAADILHRYRTGAIGPLPAGARAEILDWSKRTDPGYNPSGLMVLASFPEPAVIDRLGRLLRDPRADVRAGAIVTVRRMALSHTDLTGGPLRSALTGWLAHRKTPPDAMAELVKLVGDLGWDEHRQAVLDVAGTSAPVTEAVELASTRLAARTDAATWGGVWVSDGLDVLEQAEAKRETSWMLIAKGVAVVDGADPVSAELGDGGLVVEGLGTLRAIWAPTLSEPVAVAAVQIPGRTWYQIDDVADLVAWMEDHQDLVNERHTPATDALVDTIGEAEGAVADRGRAIAALLAGDVHAALDKLGSLTTGKRPRADLYYWLGRAHQAAGDAAAALEAYDTYIERAGKKAQFRVRTKARRAEVGGT